MSGAKSADEQSKYIFIYNYLFIGSLNIYTIFKAIAFVFFFSFILLLFSRIHARTVIAIQRAAVQSFVTFSLYYSFFLLVSIRQSTNKLNKRQIKMIKTNGIGRTVMYVCTTYNRTAHDRTI